MQRKKCVWTTKYRKLINMCIVQHVDMKRVLTFQSKKLLVSTTVKSTKPAATFPIIFLTTKNRHLCCLVVVLHKGLQQRRVVTTKKSHLNFWRNFSANQNQANPNLNQKKQKAFLLSHNRVDTPSVAKVNQNFIYILNIYAFSLH